MLPRQFGRLSQLPSLMDPTCKQSAAGVRIATGVQTAAGVRMDITMLCTGTQSHATQHKHKAMSWIIQSFFFCPLHHLVFCPLHHLVFCPLHHLVASLHQALHHFIVCISCISALSSHTAWVQQIWRIFCTKNKHRIKYKLYKDSHVYRKGRNPASYVLRLRELYARMH